MEVKIFQTSSIYMRLHFQMVLQIAIDTVAVSQMVSIKNSLGALFILPHIGISEMHGNWLINSYFDKKLHHVFEREPS